MSKRLKIVRQNCGVEIAAKDFKVCLQWLNEAFHPKIKASRKFPNTKKGIEDFAKWLSDKKHKDLDLSVTMEATGIYYEELAYYFFNNTEYAIHVVLPNKSKAHRQSMNIKTKTDDSDVKVLANMGLTQALPKWKPMSKQMRSLKKINRERLRLIGFKTMAINQLHAELHSYEPEQDVVDRCKSRIAFMEEQIADTEKQLKEKVKKDGALAERINNVCTAKGLGFITVCGVIAEMNGFANFYNRGQVVSYAGYDVIRNESGSSVSGKTKISKKGNSYVRKMLFMSAMSACRYDEHHKNYYSRIVEKTSIKMKGNVAIQRKLLLLIYTLFKNNVPYDKDHHMKEKKRLAGKKKLQLAKI